MKTYPCVECGDFFLKKSQLDPNFFKMASIFAGNLMLELYEEDYGHPPETFQHLYGVAEELESYITK